MRWISWLILGWATLSTASQPQLTPPFPTNDDPSNQIRFSNEAEADAARDALIQYIWDGGLPTSVPIVHADIALPPNFDDAQNIPWTLDPTLYTRIDWLQAWVADWDFFQNTLLIHPTLVNGNNQRLVIVHQGHVNWDQGLAAGIQETIEAVLAEGYTVAAHQMAAAGWGMIPFGDVSGNVPGHQGEIHWRNVGISAGIGVHESFMLNTGPCGGGWGFRLFLDDIIQTVNYWTSLPGSGPVSMVGTSGGGWSTHMAAAIDPRITLSVPVAGAAPLYHKNVSPGSVGDYEQFWVPLFDEDIDEIGEGGGVATWLEVFALGGYGEDRRQIMVTNLNEGCCFGGTFPDSFENIVAAAVTGLGGGAWEHEYDPSNLHQINPNTIDEILLPALIALPEPPRALAQLAGLLGLSLLHRWKRRSRRPREES